MLHIMKEIVLIPSITLYRMEDVVARRLLLHCSPPFLPKNLKRFQKKRVTCRIFTLETNMRLCQQTKKKTQDQIKRGKR